MEAKQDLNDPEAETPKKKKAGPKRQGKLTKKAKAKASPAFQTKPVPHPQAVCSASAELAAQPEGTQEY